MVRSKWQMSVRHIFRTISVAVHAATKRVCGVEIRILVVNCFPNYFPQINGRPCVADMD